MKIYDIFPKFNVSVPMPEVKPIKPQMPKTLCKNCKHFWLTEKREPWRDIWYSHRCLASTLPIVYNTATGKVENDGEERYSYCRDINKGDCSKFEGK